MILKTLIESLSGMHLSIAIVQKRLLDVLFVYLFIWKTCDTLCSRTRSGVPAVV